MEDISQGRQRHSRSHSRTGSDVSRLTRKVSIVKETDARVPHHRRTRTGISVGGRTTRGSSFDLITSYTGSFGASFSIDEHSETEPKLDLPSIRKGSLKPSRKHSVERKHEKKPPRKHSVARHHGNQNRRTSRLRTVSGEETFHKETQIRSSISAASPLREVRNKVTEQSDCWIAKPEPATDLPVVRTKYVNWAKTYKLDVDTVEVREEADITSVVLAANRLGTTVRAIGSLYSWPSIALPTQRGKSPNSSSRSRSRARSVADSVVSLAPKAWQKEPVRPLAVAMHLYNNFISVDKTIMQVEVQAGITIKELNVKLREHGLALATLGNVDGQTIAGAISTGTHGKNPTQGCLTSLVVGVRVVMASGEAKYIGRGSELFAAMGVSVGLLGIVSTVVLDVVPAFNLYYSVNTCGFEEGLEKVSEVVQHPQDIAISFIYFPGIDRFRIETAKRGPHPGTDDEWKPDPTDPVLVEEGRMKLKPGDERKKVEDEVFEMPPRYTMGTIDVLRVVLVVLGWVELLFPIIGRPLARAIIALAHRRGEREKPYYGPSHKILSNNAEFNLKHYEMEFAYPKESAIQVLSELRTVLGRFGPIPSLAVDVRFSKGDDFYLSPAYKRDTVWVDIIVAKDGPKEYDHIYDAVVPIAKRYGGRPHWGKVNFASAGYTVNSFPEAVTFEQIRSQLDPAELFYNKYLLEIIKVRRSRFRSASGATLEDVGGRAVLDVALPSKSDTRTIAGQAVIASAEVNAKYGVVDPSILEVKPQWHINWARTYKRFYNTMQIMEESDIVRAVLFARRTHTTVRPKGSLYSWPLMSLPSRRVAIGQVPHQRFERRWREDSYVDADEHQRSTLSAMSSAANLNHREDKFVQPLVIEMEGYGAVLDVDKINMRVEVQAGAKLIDFCEILRSEGLALATMGNVNGQSVAGAFSTGTHGKNPSKGSIASQVVALRLITSTGDVVVLNKGDTKFDAAGVSLGLLGIISTVTFSVVPAFNLEYTVETVSFEEGLKEFDQVLDTNNEAVSFVYFPSVDSFRVERSRRRENDVVQVAADSHAQLSALNDESEFRLPTSFSTFFLFVIRVALTIIAWVEALLPCVGAVIAKFAIRLLYGYDAGEVFYGPSHKILPNNASLDIKHYEMEFAFPSELAQEVVRDVREALEPYRKWAGLVVDVRFTGGEDLYLSPAYGRDTVWVDIIVVKHGPSRYQRVYEAILPVAKKYEGRPHWGKVNPLPPKYTSRVFPKSIEFEKIRQEMDPDNLFFNEYLATINHAAQVRMSHERKSSP